MPLSLLYHRVDVAANSVPCISGSYAVGVPVFTCSTQYLLATVFRFPVLCCSHFEQSFLLQHNENLFEYIETLPLFHSKSGRFTLSFGLSVPFGRGGVVQVCSDVPLVYGTVASYHLQVPGSGHRYIAALVSIYVLFRLSELILQVRVATCTCSTACTI